MFNMVDVVPPPVPCVYCQAPLHDRTRWAHVWPRSLGGRLRSRGICCDDCNNVIGEVEDDVRGALLHANAALGATRDDGTQITATLIIGDLEFEFAWRRCGPAASRPIAWWCPWSPARTKPWPVRCAARPDLEEPSRRLLDVAHVPAQYMPPWIDELRAAAAARRTSCHQRRRRNGLGEGTRPGALRQIIPGRS